MKRLLPKHKQMLKLGKNGQKLAKDASLHPWKLKTHVKTIFAFKVIFLKKQLEFKDALNLCYSQNCLAKLIS